MYPIRYYYSSFSKQFFLSMLIFFLISRFAVYYLALSVVEGFAEQTYVLPTALVYLLGVFICLFLLLAYRFSGSTFDEQQITYCDKLRKREHTVAYDDVTAAHFAKKGIFLYGDAAQEQILLKIPFHHFGNISPVGVENFLIMMKNKGIPVAKDYEVLSGYGPSAKWIARGFLFFGFILMLYSLRQSALVYMILASPN